jgi:hypothetical protein
MEGNGGGIGWRMRNWGSWLQSLNFVFDLDCEDDLERNPFEVIWTVSVAEHSRELSGIEVLFGVVMAEEDRAKKEDLGDGMKEFLCLFILRIKGGFYTNFNLLFNLFVEFLVGSN